MEWLVDEVQPSLDATMKVAKSSPEGADVVAAKLDIINNTFLQLVTTLRTFLESYAAGNPHDKTILVSFSIFIAFQLGIKELKSGIRKVT